MTTDTLVAPATSADTLRVILTGNGTEWRGTFAEFAFGNQDGMSITTLEEAADALLRNGRFTFGGGAAPEFTLRREPTAEEILNAARGWRTVLPGYNVRMLAPTEACRAGDFELSETYSGDPADELQALYAGSYAVGVKTPRTWRTDGKFCLIFRYTRTLFTDEPNVYADAGEAEVMAALDAQNEEIRAKEAVLATQERQKFGEAVIRYRGALEARADEETLRAMRASVDELLNAMKYQREGIWWDAAHGTWGFGEAPWREDEGI